jgi:FMN-dependent NADH-azoreductase
MSFPPSENSPRFSACQDDRGLLTGEQADIVRRHRGGDFSPGSAVEKYNRVSGYLRQVMVWIGIKDVEIILAGRARAGATGEAAIKQFGADVSSAAAATPAVAA